MTKQTLIFRNVCKCMNIYISSQILYSVLCWSTFGRDYSRLFLGMTLQVWHTYSEAKKYLVSHQLCKFSHLKRWERPVIFIIGTLQLWQTKWERKSRKSHCRIFNEFICKLWWKISIWSPTNKRDFWLSQTCNFFFKRLLCPPLVTCINGTCLNLLSV